jgi:hypothetical protein
MRTALLLVAVAGCAGTRPPAMPPLPSWDTTSANLAPGRCTGATCVCRAAEGDDFEKTPIPDGMKRFELRVSTGPGVAWVTIDGERFYKGGERSTECWYLDLGPGKHPVALRTHSSEPQGGFGVELSIREHNPKGPWWYETFSIRCGWPGACDVESLRDWKRRVEGYEENRQDACGSVKLRGIGWVTGRVPDALHPEEIAMDVTLDVYPFEPKEAPGPP